MAKEEILNNLKKREKSTSEIASIISKNYYDCLRLLQELESENLIEKIEVGNFTFWKLKKNGKEI
jgi:predicted transcriptional regulator